MLDEFKIKRLPYGFSFLNVEETRRFNTKSLEIQNILEAIHYEPITPSTLDFSDTFKVFGRNDAFTLKDRLGDDLSLRNDVTIQVIKGFSNQLESKFIKEDVSRYYYNVPVFKNIQKLYPTSREIRQVGTEIIGLKSELAIIESISIINTLMNDVFNQPYKLILGNVLIFDKLKQYLQVNNLDAIILSKNTIKLSDLFIQSGFNSKDAFTLSKALLLNLHYNLNEILQNLLYDIQIPSIQSFLLELINSLKELERICGILKEKNIPIVVEPILTCRFNYYSGLSFEGYVQGLSYPPIRGGSYDLMMQQYSQQSAPATGFALDMSSIL